jgi:PAS domain S-box-containing protein
MTFDALRNWMLGGQSSDQYKIFDALETGVWIVDSAFNTKYVNSRLAAFLDRTPSEMHGSSLLSFVPGDEHSRISECLTGSDSGGACQAEVPLIRKDGSTIFTIISATPIPADGDEQPGFICFVVDITSRRHIEDALRRSEAYYRVLTTAAQDHIFVINDDDRVEYVNQAAADQLRSTPERVIGRRRSEIFPPEVAERQSANLRKVLEEGQPLYAEGRTMYLDREVWLSTWLAPIADDSGKVTAVLGLSRDMTARKRAEDELRAAEQRLRVVMANLPLVLWASNRDGVATFCAGQALQVLGIAPAEVLGRSLNDLGVQPFTSLGEHIRRALAGESFNSQIDVQDLTFEASSVPLRDDKHNVTGATGVIVDITERRRLETELMNAQKMEAIGRLAGGIAHDFNNNLTAIIGYVDMILRQIGDDKPISGDLKEVQRAAERSAGLVRRLLAFGRRQIIQPRELNLNEVIEGLKPMLERLIGESIHVVVTLDPSLRSIVGDASQVEQVVMNLSLNARDAMPAGGTLTIVTRNATARDQLPIRAAGPHVLMTIRDTGTGMDAGTKQHLFEPFFTTKPVGAGTGLGLSTVYGIVKQLGGFITVDSEIDKGTTFRIFLPASGSAPEIVHTTAKPGPAVVGRETILLVEDEDSVRRFAKHALERHGFRVIETASPEQALSLATANDPPIDLLLTDVVMPHLSGPELAERLGKIRPDLPVLYMSGYPSSMVMQGAQSSASVRLLPKPFTTADLLANVDDVLRKVRGTS